MASYDYDIGILGGGAAGLTVASGAAQLGARTLLLEKEKELGGDCLHFGCVPSKTLIKTAKVYHQIKHSERYGLPKTETNPVDFKDVSKRIRSVISVIQKHDSVQRFQSLGAEVRFGQAEFVDEHSIRLNGKTISAKYWVIATGSSPALAPIEGLDTTPYLTNKEIFYLDALPASMAVLGAGPIGIEMAQAFQRLGTEVTVIQRSGQILGKEDHDMADAVMEALKAEGVKFLLNTTTLSVRELDGKMELQTKDTNSNTLGIKAEKLLVALGRKPNTEGLGLDAIGVKHDKRGIHVDPRLRTSHKHIFAAGDITGKYQFTHAAGYEGGVVLGNAIFRLPRKTDYRFLPWCTYTSPELASIGMNEARAKAEGRHYTVWTEEFSSNDRALAEGEATGKIKMLLDEKEKPIGVQILGPHAGDLVCEWVATLNGKVKLSTLAAAVHPYPTLGEINKRVAGNLLSKKIFSNRVRKALKFFFSLQGRAIAEDE